jgi:hypothetical protein
VADDRETTHSCRLRRDGAERRRRDTGLLYQTTTGTGAGANQHAANSTMNRAAGDVATSSQDAQKQMQAQPTAAQQAQGAKSTDQGC